MLTGVHAVLFSQDAEADMAFLQDVLKLPNVDLAEGWLVFGLPPSEVAVRPVDDQLKADGVYFMVDNIHTFMTEMKKQHVKHSDLHDTGWGSLIGITLPSGMQLSVYQPKYDRPPVQEDEAD